MLGPSPSLQLRSPVLHLVRAVLLVQESSLLIPVEVLCQGQVVLKRISSIFGRTHSTSRSSRTPTLTARTALPPPPTYWSASLVLPVPLSCHLLFSSIFCDRSTDWPGVCRCCLLHILADGFDLLQYPSEFYSCLVPLFSCKWRLSSCTLVLKLLDLVLVVLVSSSTCCHPFCRHHLVSRQPASLGSALPPLFPIRSPPRR